MYRGYDYNDTGLDIYDLCIGDLLFIHMYRRETWLHGRGTWIQWQMYRGHDSNDSYLCTGDMNPMTRTHTYRRHYYNYSGHDFNNLYRGHDSNDLCIGDMTPMTRTHTYVYGTWLQLLGTRLQWPMYRGHDSNDSEHDSNDSYLCI